MKSSLKIILFMNFFSILEPCPHLWAQGLTSNEARVVREAKQVVAEIAVSISTMSEREKALYRRSMIKAAIEHHFSSYAASQKIVLARKYDAEDTPPTFTRTTTAIAITLRRFLYAFNIATEESNLSTHMKEVLQKNYPSKLQFNQNELLIAKAIERLRFTNNLFHECEQLLFEYRSGYRRLE